MIISGKTTATVVYSVHTDANGTRADMQKRTLRFCRDILPSFGLATANVIWVKVPTRHVFECSTAEKEGFLKRALSPYNYGDMMIAVNEFRKSFEPDGGMEVGSYAVRVTRITGGFRVYLKIPLERVWSRIR